MTISLCSNKVSYREVMFFCQESLQRRWQSSNNHFSVVPLLLNPDYIFWCLRESTPFLTAIIYRWMYRQTRFVEKLHCSNFYCISNVLKSMNVLLIDIINTLKFDKETIWGYKNYELGNLGKFHQIRKFKS